MSELSCYCGAPARLRKSKYGPFWSCSRWPECDGTVGCHPGTTKPLGSLADKETRQARALAHSAFDGLWEAEDGPSRSGAYTWLAWRIEVDPEECHIGSFDLDTCKKVVAYATTTTPAEVRAWLNEVEKKFERHKNARLRSLQRDMGP